MKEMSVLVLSVASMTLAQLPLLAQLKIDFNDDDNGPRLTQEGFTEIAGSGRIVTNDYAVGDALTITLTSGLDDRERGALTGGPGLAQSALLRDFIFSTVGSKLGITLSTLKRGAYTFTGFFHDCTVKQENGTLAVDTGDGRGEVLKVPDFAYSTGTAPAVVGTAGFSFIADGSHPVTVYLSDTKVAHDNPYCINGFVLEKMEFPKGPDALVAYYDFEDRCLDVSGNENHGLASGTGVTFVTDRPTALAHSAKAADFNGTNYVTLPYLGLYGSLAATNGLTISLWIKGQSSTTQSWFLGEGCTTNSDPAYLFGHYLNEAKPTALVRTLNGNTVLMKKTATAQLYTGSWHHWVWTDLNGTANMYIDGVPAAAESGIWNYARSDMPLDTTTIGAWIRAAANQAKYPFLGQLDDVSIWNAVLSPNQIRYLAGGGDPMSFGLKGTLISIE